MSNSDIKNIELKDLPIFEECEFSKEDIRDCDRHFLDWNEVKRDELLSKTTTS